MASSSAAINDANRPSTPGAARPSQSPVELPIRTPSGPSQRSVAAVMTSSPTAALDPFPALAPAALPHSASFATHPYMAAAMPHAPVAAGSSSHLLPTPPVPVASLLNSSPQTREFFLEDEHDLDRDERPRSRADLVNDHSNSRSFALNDTGRSIDDPNSNQGNQQPGGTTSQQAPQITPQTSTKRIGSIWDADFLDGFLGILEEHLAEYLTPAGTIKTSFWPLVVKEFEKKFGFKRSLTTIRQYYNNIKKKIFERKELENKSGFGVDTQGRICCDPEVWEAFCEVRLLSF